MAQSGLRLQVACMMGCMAQPHLALGASNVYDAQTMDLIVDAQALQAWYQE